MATNYLSREQAAKALQSGKQVSFTPQGIVETSAPKSLPITGSAISGGSGGGSSNFATPNNSNKPVQAPNFISKEQAAATLQAGGQVSFTPQGITLVSAGTNLAQQIQDIRNAPISNTEIESNIQSEMAKEKANTVAKPNPLKILKYIASPVDLIFAGVNKTVKDTERFVNPKGTIDTTPYNFKDVWAGNPVYQGITEVEGAYGSSTTPTGTLTKEQIKADKQAAGKTNALWYAALPIVPIVSDWISSSKAAHKQRVAGEALTEEQKFASGKISDINTNFGNDWTPEKQADLIAQQNKVSKDIESHNQKQTTANDKANAYTEKLISYNDVYGGKSLPQADYDKAIEEKAKLDSERVQLLAEQSSLDLEKASIETKQNAFKDVFSDYSADTLARETELHKYGYTTKQVSKLDTQKIDTFKLLKDLAIGTRAETRADFSKAYSLADTKYFQDGLPSSVTPEQAKIDKETKVEVGTSKFLELPNLNQIQQNQKAISEKYGAGSWQQIAYSGLDVPLGEGAKVAFDMFVLKETGVLTPVQNALGKVVSEFPKAKPILGSIGWIGAGVYAGSGAVSGYVGAKDIGMSGWEGAIFGGETNLAKTAGFFIGMNPSKYSPITVKSEGLQGEEPSMRSLGVQNPFARNANFHPIATWNKEGVGLGWGKINQDTMAWTKEGVEGVWRPTTNFGRGYMLKNPNVLPSEKAELLKGLEIANSNWGTKTPKGVLDFRKSSEFKSLSPDFQKEILNIQAQEEVQSHGWRGVWNAFNRQGLQNVYGGISSAGKSGFEKNLYRIGQGGTTSDIDKIYYDKAAKHAQKNIDAIEKIGGSGNARIQQGSVGAVEIKNMQGKFVKVLDLHGSDTPELMVGEPWGLEMKPPQVTPDILTGKFAPVSPAYNEFIGKLGGAFGVTLSSNGNIILTGGAKRMPKDVYDTASFAENWFSKGEDTSMVSGKGNVAQLKRLINVNFGINVETGVELPAVNPIYARTGVQPWASNPKFGVTPSEALKRMDTAWEVFLPKGATEPSRFISEATFGAFKPISKASSPSNEMIYDISKWTPSPQSSVTPSSFSVASITPSSASLQSSYSPSIYSPSISSLSRSPSPSQSSVSPSASPLSVSPSRSPSASPSSASSSWAMEAVPAIPAFQIPMLSGSSWGEPKPKQRGRKKKGYTPDFTAAVLGLKMGKQSKAQVDKLLDETYTGLEIRKGW